MLFSAVGNALLRVLCGWLAGAHTRIVVAIGAAAVVLSGCHGLLSEPLAPTALTPEVRYAAPTQRVLYDFTLRTGALSDGSLIFDAAGNLYGTTFLGGAKNDGTVFELSPGPKGTWTGRVLHSFNFHDGANPNSELIMDSTGKLYGTTAQGGLAARSGGTVGAGVVFELTPTGSGAWKERVIHLFGKGTDGYKAYAGLVRDASGNLYGTTAEGGNYTASCGQLGCGTVYELERSGLKWTETVLHRFAATHGDILYGGVAIDAAGNLFGTTLYGGTHRLGVAFELKRDAKGNWKEKTIYDFCAAGNCSDGAAPETRPLLDAAGNLYIGTSGGGTGTACYGGPCGAIVKLSPVRQGMWTNTVLHAFDKTDGAFPDGNLIFDASGNLYGVTNSGGTGPSGGDGVTFELSPAHRGKWTYDLLTAFDGKDGNNPYGGLVLNGSGNLYGTTEDGGTGSGCRGSYGGCGVVYEVTRKRHATLPP